MLNFPMIFVLLLQLLQVQQSSANTVSELNVVEISLFVDFSSWQFFVTHFGEVHAEVQIKHYYGYMLQGMQQILSKMEDKGLRVKPIITDITIFKNSQPSWLIVENGIVNGQNTLYAVSDFLLESDKFYQYDHLMVVTRFPINGGYDGMAYPGATCQESGLSIVRDSGLGTWQTAAHELIHSLGGGHNTESECGDAKGYLMNGGSDSIDIPSMIHSCTVREISNYIDGLDRDLTNCMRVTTKVNILEEFKRTYSLDEACKFHDSLSQYIGPSTASASSCTLLECTKPDGSTTSTSEARAAVGTECGKDGVCEWDGTCRGSSGSGSSSCLDRYGKSFCQDFISYGADSGSYKSIYCSDADLMAGCCETFTQWCK